LTVAVIVLVVPPAVRTREVGARVMVGSGVTVMEMVTSGSTPVTSRTKTVVVPAPTAVITPLVTPTVRTAGFVALSGFQYAPVRFAPSGARPTVPNCSTSPIDIVEGPVTVKAYSWISVAVAIGVSSPKTISSANNTDKIFFIIANLR